MRPQDPDSRGDLLRSVATIEVGIVAAEAGFADTGALAVRGGKQRPCWLPTYLGGSSCRCRPAISSPALSHWLANEAADTGEVVTFLTGPSQSLDLEADQRCRASTAAVVHVVSSGHLTPAGV